MAEKQRILIVDDDPSISELITLYLNKERYDTRCVEDGEEALREFAEKSRMPVTGDPVEFLGRPYQSDFDRIGDFAKKLVDAMRG